MAKMRQMNLIKIRQSPLPSFSKGGKGRFEMLFSNQLFSENPSCFILRESKMHLHEHSKETKFKIFFGVLFHVLC